MQVLVLCEPSMCFVHLHLIHSNQNRPIACIHHVLEAVQTRESCFLVSACFPFIAGHAFHLYFVQIQILPGLLFTHHQTQNGSVVVVNLLITISGSVLHTHIHHQQHQQPKCQKELCFRSPRICVYAVPLGPKIAAATPVRKRLVSRFISSKSSIRSMETPTVEGGTRRSVADMLY